MKDPRVRLATTIIDSSDADLIGSVVHQISVMRRTKGELVSFDTPSVAHLALEAAVRSAHKANECRATLVTSTPDRTVFPEPVSYITNGQAQGALFDTFLHAMSAAIFSYLSLENFANEVIGRHPDILVTTVERPRVTKGSRKSERRREKKVSGAAREAEKKSLGIKLSQVLPQITGIPIDKGKAPYQQFQELERMRDGVIHLKSSSSAPRIQNLDKVPKQPVWTNFVYEDSLWMPNVALQVIRYFRIGTLPLDWLSDIEEQMKGVDLVVDSENP